jgi:hypothetical protein
MVLNLRGLFDQTIAHFDRETAVRAPVVPVMPAVPRRGGFGRKVVG